MAKHVTLFHKGRCSHPSGEALRTGYSPLSTLHAFPFDKIKLDQSFVRRLPDDVSAGTIVRTVLTLGKSLGVPVPAGGIETEAQLQFLVDEGCKEGHLSDARPVLMDKIPHAVMDIYARADSEITDENVAA